MPRDIPHKNYLPSIHALLDQSINFAMFLIPGCFPFSLLTYTYPQLCPFWLGAIPEEIPFYNSDSSFRVTARGDLVPFASKE